MKIRCQSNLAIKVNKRLLIIFFMFLLYLLLYILYFIILHWHLEYLYYL